MKKYHNIQELVEGLSGIQWDSAAFCALSKWRSNPESCEIIVLEGDDELEDLGDIENHIPKIAIALGIRQLLDTETLRDVIDIQNGLNPDSSSYEYVRAINYYREFDRFFDSNA